MKILPKVLKYIISVLIILALIILAYVIYVISQYSRIPDNQNLEIIHNSNAIESSLNYDTFYSATTYNIGFGAYTHDFSFFMDSGVMKDGTKVAGKYGRAFSLEDVNTNTEGAIETIKKLNPTFALFQEVDTNSDRSFHVDQVEKIGNSFNDMAYNYAVNYHSPYLALPLNNPHGFANAGIMTLSKYSIDKAIRKTYPLSDVFPQKYLDLDRCFSVTYISVEGSKKLSLINSHMSAYDKGGLVRAKQLILLNEYMREEYNKGNYVIVGGDFNHALGKDVIDNFESEQEIPEWVNLLTNEDLDPSMSICAAENETEVATCRSTDMPYTKGVNYSTVVDGFIISDNIEAYASNIDNNYIYSDHQPVLLKFKLKK